MVDRMREYGSLPRARKDGLVEEAVGEELLLYDRDSHAAHCLSPIAAYVWRHCDGERDVIELAELVGVSEGLVADALYELCEKDLLDAEPELMQGTVPGISRREAIGRVARYGAAATAGSLIVSATAATPAMASSGEEKPCAATACLGQMFGTCCKCTNECCKSSFATAGECETWCKGQGSKKSKFEKEFVCSNGM